MFCRTDGRDQRAPVPEEVGRMSGKPDIGRTIADHNKGALATSALVASAPSIRLLMPGGVSGARSLYQPALCPINSPGA